MLLVEKNGAVATVTLNRPEAMNAMSKQMRSELYKAMVALNDD
ncbi:MAG TPA: enoyl-CoA hydratase-related protein, partial [Caulobacteraceae bacterium]